MMNNQGKIMFCGFLMICLILFYMPALAQNPVDVEINANEYDVLFLTDLFNVKTQKLSSNVSNFSVDLDIRPAPRNPLPVCIQAFVQVRLRGDAGFTRLVRGISQDFEIPITGHKRLTARDFAGSGIASSGNGRFYEQDNKLKRRIAEFAQTNPTAPPGTYQITIIVHSAGTNNVDNNILGKDTKTIVIPYSSVDEVFVEINDPKNGSYFTNLAPTFNWTTSEKDVRVTVFEAGTNHRSPQDVLTGGNPCLVWKSYADAPSSSVSDRSSVTAGVRPEPQQKEQGLGSSLTYPANAQRQLQDDKAYVLQVEVQVQTNRGPMMRPSKPVVFRITDDKTGKILDNFMNTLSDKISSDFSTLRADPSSWVYWSSYGDMTLDGKKLTEPELQALLKDLSGRTGTKYELEVANQ